MDIKAFVEYESPCQDRPPFVICAGEAYIPNDPQLFMLLADLGTPLGLPRNASRQVLDAYTVRVGDDNARGGVPGYVTAGVAAQLGTEPLGPGRYRNPVYRDATWLNLRQIEEVGLEYEARYEGVTAHLVAIGAQMAKLESTLQVRARLVLWFTQE